MKNVRTYAANCLKEEAQAIMGLIPLLDDNFDKAVEMIYSCQGKVIVTGVGKSGHIGAKIAATLSSTGTPSFFLNPLDAYHGDLGVVTSQDIVVAISNSGQTDELLRFVPMLIHMGIPIIGMSGNPKSLLAKYSNVHINVAVEREACPLNLAPTSSTTAVLSMGDALAVALMVVRNFKPKDFAQFHPRRRAWQAPAHHGCRRHAHRRHADHSARNAPRRGHHSCEQRQARHGRGSA